MVAASFHRQRRVRIFRGAALAPFQPDWQPVADPYAEGGASRSAAALPRIPRRYSPYVMSVTVSVAMSGVISLIVAIKTFGISFDTPVIWLAAWPVSCMIAVPMRFVVAPLVDRFVNAVVEPPL